MGLCLLGIGILLMKVVMGVSRGLRLLMEGQGSQQQAAVVQVSFWAGCQTKTHVKGFVWIRRIFKVGTFANEYLSSRNKEYEDQEEY
jgi:hypothetical protein